MDSTNHNLENPCRVDILQIVKDVESWDFPTIKRVTQEFYDLMKKHDPLVIYSITNSPDMRVYYGDHLVLKTSIRKQRYFMTILDDGSYSISLNQVNGHNDNLIEICRFDDPQKAIDTLSIFNNVGGHGQKYLHLVSLIRSFCFDDISCHDLIIGIMSEFGYKDDPRLQQVIQSAHIYGATNEHRYLPDKFISFLADMIVTDQNGNHGLYKMYSEIYGILLATNFVNIVNSPSDVIRKIVSVFGE